MLLGLVGVFLGGSAGGGTSLLMGVRVGGVSSISGITRIRVEGEMGGEMYALEPSSS
jgi:hypothetical protein